jgi:transcriptional regulator with XRE-family HTH domain
VIRGDAEKKQIIIEWLCLPKRERDPATQQELAKRLRISNATITKWKSDPKFIEKWDQHYLTTIGSPERKQALLDTLYRTGTDADDPRHVQAAAKYMEIVDGLKPQKLDITVHRPAKDLSDEELDQIAAQYVARERAAREQEQAS